jgi:uncharacterized protein (TIGR02145 family)
LKEAGTVYWNSPNTGATNSSGFAALPSGYRDMNGLFDHIGRFTYFWTFGYTNYIMASMRYLGYNYVNLRFNSMDNTNGFSVRCVKTIGYTLPNVTTGSANYITQNSAICDGNVVDDGGDAVLTRGICWSANSNPTNSDFYIADGNGTGTFTGVVTGLIPNTTYYARAYAVNTAGITYGSQISFTTLQETGITVTDIDGNLYHTVKIGTQIWMVENLKTTKLNDGTAITFSLSEQTWSDLTTPGYSLVAYEGSENLYGYFYNWYAVNTGKLAPTGWHVPNNTDFETLINYLGGSEVAGGKLKEAGTEHWNSPNTGATNSSGFTALPGGYMSQSGTRYSFGEFGEWWSATQTSNQNGSLMNITFGGNRADIGSSPPKFGFNIRCLKD